MKKLLLSLVASILFVLTFALSACGDDKNGTYYPDITEMGKNLECAGYSVSYPGYVVGFQGKILLADKEKDFIAFYWLENADDCDKYYNSLEEYYPDSEVLVKIKNDEKFGNIVYCGTSEAINAAGIKVVKVDVKI